MYQLISYIALGAPATRRPASGDLPWLRPEIGFTPNWYHKALNIDFEVGELSSEETRRAECLVIEKHNNREWVFRK